MNPKYSIFEIANWFLTKDSMTPKKLQKLSYYAEAWSNALFNDSLINDTKFEAWAHGPVSPELYSKYKGYGWSEIPKSNDGSTNLDLEKIDLLESVWITYGDKSANELEALTHQELPWREARNGIAEGERCNSVISTEVMHSYYKSIYNGD